MAQGNLTLRVEEAPLVVQPNPFAEGQTVVIPRTDANIQEEPGNGLAIVDNSVSLPEVVAGLREAVDEQTKARAQHWLRRTMTAPEDAEVEALCERCGYGAVMDAASRLWARKPYGSGAFYIGGCIGFKSDEEARAALATQEAGT